jgi:hypothetical protein
MRKRLALLMWKETYYILLNKNTSIRTAWVVWLHPYQNIACKFFMRHMQIKHLAGHSKNVAATAPREVTNVVMEREPFLEVVGFKLRALCLLGRHSTAWATPLALFALIILEIGSCFLPRAAWTMILLFFCVPLSLGWQVCATTKGFFSPRWGTASFPWGNQGWPETIILPISAYLIAWDDRGMPLSPIIGWVIGCQGWPCTMILLIPSSRVAKTIGVSHWCLAWTFYSLLYSLIFTMSTGCGFHHKKWASWTTGSPGMPCPKSLF